MPETYDRAEKRRAFWVNTALAVPVVALIVFIVSYGDCDAACSDWDYVDDLLLDNGQNEAVLRWDHAPSVGTQNGNPKEIDMLADAVDATNQLMTGIGFALRFRHADTANIKVTFGSREELALLIPDTDVDAEAEGYATWNIQNHKLYSANIYVVRNLEPGRKWGTILHELGHTLGIIGHTDGYLSSLFYVELGYGTWSDGYSADDRKLLIFLYEHLQSGDKEPQVRVAFDKYWVLRSD